MNRRFPVIAVAVAIAIAVVLPSMPAQANPSSGMLLGVYAFPNSQGLRITGIIPGYSAHGKLFRDDVLLRVTDGVQMYPVRNTWQIEHAKNQIGPFQPAAMEVFRPGAGYQYLWVEFRPVGGGVAAYSANSQVEARIMTESERPGARALFHKGGRSPRDSANFDSGWPTGHSGSSSSRDAAALFR